MPDSSESNEAPAPGIHRARGWRAAWLWLLSVLVRGWCRTLRVHISPADFAAGSYAQSAVMLLLWHNRLFFVPWLVRRLRCQRPIYAMVSPSRDGANLSRFFEYVGVRTVRGSSSRLGREALHELIAQQRAGCDMAITPDGPRGPLYDMKPGALLAARRTRAPLILLGIEFASAWRLPSWDRFYLPRPFSRVIVRCERIDPATLGPGQAAVVELRRRLLKLSGEPLERPAR